MNAGNRPRSLLPGSPFAVRVIYSIQIGETDVSIDYVNFDEAFRAAGVLPDNESYNETYKLCKKTLDKIEELSSIHFGDMYLFVSERMSQVAEDQKPEAMWAFGDNLAFTAPITPHGGGDVTVVSESQEVEVAENTAGGQRTLIVKVNGPHGPIELRASGDNCDVLYGALPYLRGRAANPAKG
jgi:hypothetical protein